MNAQDQACGGGFFGAGGGVHILCTTETKGEGRLGGWAAIKTNLRPRT